MTSQSEKVIYSKRQLLSHILILNLVSVNAYSWWWYYKNWKELQEFARKASPEVLARAPERPRSLKTIEYFKKMNVIVHAIGVIPPFIQLIFTYQMFKQLAEICPDYKLPSPVVSPQSQARQASKSLVAFNPALTGIVFTCTIWFFTRENGFAPIVAALGATPPLMISQDLLNDFWMAVEEPGLEVRRHFNSGEWILLFCGIVMLGFTLFSQIIPGPKI